MSEFYIVVNTDLSQREMSRMGNEFISIRIFTDKKKQKSGHHWDIEVKNESGHKTLSFNGDIIDSVVYDKEEDDRE